MANKPRSGFSIFDALVNLFWAVVLSYFLFGPISSAVSDSVKPLLWFLPS